MKPSTRGKAKPAAKAKPVTKRKPAAKARPTAKQAPVAKARPAAKQPPVAKARPAAKQAPVAKARPAAKQPPVARPAAKAAAPAAPQAEARPAGRGKPAPQAQPEASRVPPESWDLPDTTPDLPILAGDGADLEPAEAAEIALPDDDLSGLLDPEEGYGWEGEAEDIADQAEADGWADDEDRLDEAIAEEAERHRVEPGSGDPGEARLRSLLRDAVKAELARRRRRE